MDFIIKHPFLCYALLVNIAAAIVCIIDKRRSIKHRRRISEDTLVIFSAIGGAVGMLITMCTIRHKTRHTKFMVGLPLIIVLQILVICIAYEYMPELFK